MASTKPSTTTPKPAAAAPKADAPKAPKAKGQTRSEPVAMPDAVDDRGEVRVFCDTEQFDYVKVQPRLDGVRGAHTRGTAYYRALGYKPVTIQSRDDQDVILTYPSQSVRFANGDVEVIPTDQETLTPGLILMARPKEIGDREREKQRHKNNPQYVDPRDVSFSRLVSQDGVLAQERKAVDPEKALPGQGQIDRESKRLERIAAENPGFMDKVVEAAMNDKDESGQIAD